VTDTGVAAGSLALQIANGTVRLDNDLATHFGDIDVPAGAAGRRPVLSVRNGVLLRSAIRFADLTTFETEITPANFGTSREVPPAVEVRALVTSTGNNIRVFNRINFLALPTGGVRKGDKVQLLSGSPIQNYEASEIWPIEQDTQTKAPFDPFVSNNYLYFEATHNIDVPVFGTPSALTVAPGANYRIVIPVETTTNLRAETLDVAGLAGATAVLEGNNIVITGAAPELVDGAEELVLAYRISVSSGSLGDTLGYVNTGDFELTVTEADVPPAPVRGPAWTWTGVAISDDLSAVTGTVTLLIDGDPLGAAVPVTVSVYEGTTEVASSDVTLAAATGSVAFTVDGTYEYDTAYTVRAVSGTAAYDSVASASTTVRKATPVTPPDERGSSSGGCDAGFGAFALLAATGAVTLLRKKG
jgi:Synergist-CTERM protein sorting domain-containing protein